MEAAVGLNQLQYVELLPNAAMSFPNTFDDYDGTLPYTSKFKFSDGITLFAWNRPIGQPQISVGPDDNRQKHSFGEGERCFMHVGSRYYTLERRADTDLFIEFFVELSNDIPADTVGC